MTEIAIIDIEIANNMDKSTWDNKKADINLIGALLCKDNKIDSIIQIPRLKGVSKEEYSKKIVNLLHSLREEGYTFWALNSRFEQEAISSYCDLYLSEFPFNEIRGHLKGSLSSKDNLYSWLRGKLEIPLIHDPLDGGGKMIPDYYSTYIDSDNFKWLQDIMAHNVNCLLKEFYIKLHIVDIQKAVLTDSNGFIIELSS